MELADKQVSTSTQLWINRVERSRQAKVNCFSELRSWVQHAILEAEEKKDFDKKGKFLNLLNDLETCPRTVSAMKMTEKGVQKPWEPKYRQVSTSLSFLWNSAREVDPDKFFDALNSAWETKKATCGKLSIQCRSKTQDKAIFLILSDSAVVAQFPIPNEFLLKRNNPIKNLMKTDTILRQQNKKNEKSQVIPIRDLRSGMTHVNLRAKVLEIPRPKLVFTRFGSYASVTSALIGDETGTIKLCLWNEQIKSISDGDTIQIENARTSTFKGEMQLNIRRNGTLSNIEDPYSQLKELNTS